MIDLFLLPKDVNKSGFVYLTAGLASAIKANFSASVDPTNTDDGSAGYSVGSIWINTTLDKVFVCVDSTNSSAVWRSFIDPSLSSSYAVTSGTNTYTANLSPALPSYVNGLTVILRFGIANTGASTINLNSRGAKNIFKNGSALSAGDIQAGGLVILAFNNTDNRFDMVAGGTSGGGSSSASLDPFLIIGG